MTSLLPLIALIAIFIATMYTLNRFVLEPKRRREAEAAPRITLSEVQSFWTRIEESSLPIAKAEVQVGTVVPNGNRIGGAPLAIGDDMSWPRSAQSDFPMALVAQLNFSEVPAIDDFPTQGVLQIFTSFNMIDDFGGCERVIRWDPDPQTDEVLEIPEEMLKTTRQTRDFSERARRSGLPLVFKADTAPASPFNWPHEAKNPIYENRLPESDEVATILDNWEDRSDEIHNGYGDHWVGGHPSFIQEDVRLTYQEGRHLDRVIFHLGCDDDINLGDGGEANIMISQEALLNRDFQKAFLTWDCS